MKRQTVPDKIMILVNSEEHEANKDGFEQYFFASEILKNYANYAISFKLCDKPLDQVFNDVSIYSSVKKMIKTKQEGSFLGHHLFHRFVAGRKAFTIGKGLPYRHQTEKNESSTKTRSGYSKSNPPKVSMNFEKDLERFPIKCKLVPIDMPEDCKHNAIGGDSGVTLFTFEKFLKPAVDGFRINDVEHYVLLLN